MTNKQFNLLICAIIFSAIILSMGIALVNGPWEFKLLSSKDIVWIRFNRFTGKTILVSFVENKFKSIDIKEEKCIINK